VEHHLTLPDGSREIIPAGLCPVWRDGWCATNAAATVEGVAATLARAEGQASAAAERAEYLRGLMVRVLAAAERKACPLCAADHDAGACTFQEHGAERAEGPEEVA